MQDFRELDIDLPKQPITNQLPWLIAGFVLMLAILTMAACAYFEHKANLLLKNGESVSFRTHRQQTIIDLINDNHSLSAVHLYR